MTSQTERFLRTEELYDLITKNIAYSEDPTQGFHSSTQVRRVLDQIISQGKIEGRLSAHTDASLGVLLYHDRLIKDWQRIVDSN